MICYRDMTFCNYYKECAVGDTCSRALTEEVLGKAERWWGSTDVPICTYVDKPSCFKREEKCN